MDDELGPGKGWFQWQPCMQKPNPLPSLNHFPDPCGPVPGILRVQVGTNPGNCLGLTLGQRNQCFLVLRRPMEAEAPLCDAEVLLHGKLWWLGYKQHSPLYAPPENGRTTGCLPFMLPSLLTFFSPAKDKCHCCR